MKGAWVLLLQAALALIIGLLIAQEVYHQVVVSGEVSDEGALLDQFQGGLGLAVEMVSSAPPEAREAVARSLSAHFGCPVYLVPSEGILPRVDLADEPIFTVALRGDDRAMIIGPIPDPSRLDRANRHGMALLAVVLVMLGTAAVLVVPIARRLHVIEQAIDALADGQHSARAPVQGSDAVSRLAERLSGLTAENERLLAADQRLLQAVADELRAPCQRLRFRLASVRDGEAASADAVERDLDALDALAGELQVFLRYGQRPVEREALTPLPGLAEQVEDLALVYPGIAFTLPEVAPELTVEPRGFLRVMHSLLSNAARHATAVVVVEIVETRDGVVVAVVDDGAGIDAADRQRIFEPFARVDASRARASGGAGLGLAIARRILEAHGGSIAALEGPIGARLETRWPRADPA